METIKLTTRSSALKPLYAPIIQGFAFFLASVYFESRRGEILFGFMTLLCLSTLAWTYLYFKRTNPSMLKETVTKEALTL